MNLKRPFTYLLFFLGGFVCGSALVVGCLYIFAVMYFRMPGDGPLYHFAGWKDDIKKISSAKIDRDARPLPYTLLNIDGEPEKKKYLFSITVNVLLNEHEGEAPSSQLAATCAAGAKYYAKKYSKENYGPDAVHFIIYEDKKYFDKEIRLIAADCLYSPTGLGWDSREEHPWEWQDLRVQERPFTAKELEVKSALAAMQTRDDSLKSGKRGIDWEGEDVGRLTGMTREEVFKIETFKNKALFPAAIFKNISPQGPTSEGESLGKNK